MPDAYVIEVSGRTAGIVAWEPPAAPRNRIFSGQVGTKDRHLGGERMSRRFRGGRCVPGSMQRDLEALDRFAKVFGAEAESFMMDRHHEISVGFIGHLHSLFRSAVRLNPETVSADCHDRRIDEDEPHITALAAASLALHQPASGWSAIAKETAVRGRTAPKNNLIQPRKTKRKEMS